ncbi:MAG: hypothetical protein IJW14_03985 [Oscillospiraceae bacterium]|nr:hypothetical protein [Oscillospiraceae bacterium]
MKKIMLVCLCVILLLLCGCATQSNINDTPAEDVSLNPAGTYTDVSFNDTNSLYVDFKVQSSGKESEKETIVITSTDTGYSYQDSVFSGRLTNNGDGDYTATKEQVITNDPLLLKTAELELKQNPYTFYKVYDDYLIKKVPLSNVTMNGELPSEGKKTTCFIYIEHISFSTFTLSLSSDGSCEMMTVFNNDICSASGTYSVKGRIISLTFTEGVFYEEELGGNIEMVLYAEDNTLYDMVYRRK